MILGELRESLDKRRKCGALFMDLSKMFDFLPHDVLLTKLEAHDPS